MCARACVCFCARVCVCGWVDSRDSARETAETHMHVCVFTCVSSHEPSCTCVFVMIAIVMLICQFAASPRFQILSLAFLRRIGAKQNERQSNKTTRRRPQAHLSPPFIFQHLQILLCVNMHSKSCRWEELAQKTRGGSVASIRQSIQNPFI